MAWNFERDLFDASNFHGTSTPNVPYSSASIGEKCGGHHIDDSGYFTQLKPLPTRLSLTEQNVDFPPLNLEVSEEETGQINADQHSGAAFSDSGIDYESVENTEQECRLRLEDETSIYSSPDAVDRFATTDVSEISSFTHSSHDFVLEKHRAMVQQPCRVSHVDFIRDLSQFPHVLAVILWHVSDTDLCRMSCVSHTWQNAVRNDKVSRERKLHYLEVYAQNKENAAVKARIVARAMTSASQPLCAVQRTNVSSDGRGRSRATAEDTSLQRCRRYWQVGWTLPAGERLSKCPRCESPVRTVKGRACCTSPECGYDVCVTCQHSYHGPAACRPVPPRSSACIGSRASKKRLHRLCS